MGAYGFRMDTRSAANAVATVLSGIMLDDHVTPHALATSAQIPRTTLMRRLSGASAFTVDELSRVARVLGRQPSDILRAAEDVTP